MAPRGRVGWMGVGTAIFGALLLASFAAPEFLSAPIRGASFKGPLDVIPFGTDALGRPLLEYALQGAQIVTLPSMLAAVVVSFLAIVAGMSRSVGWGWSETSLQAFTELVGALPRLVVVLVVALGVPRELRSLYPIAVTWAVLAAPGAMDEAAATAERLGGARFVEALRAHGFSAFRIYVIHILWYNLRSVIVRQAAEVAMQVMFLEIALSYLAARRSEPSLTHLDSTNSWAALLYDGYTALVGGVPALHALGLGLGLVALVAVMSQAMRIAARPR
jgi:ABC-type dipeptide/oligopeptide/nickel transport system permease subunit